jgi:hypothetical protein
MLVFESLSAGVLALAVGFAGVMLVVGVYVVVIWPLTFWDLGSLGWEKYASWTSSALWSVFAGGSLAGYWCFSGAAFKHRSKAKTVASRATHTRR